jgi:hypothetical protein
MTPMLLLVADSSAVVSWPRAYTLHFCGQGKPRSVDDDLIESGKGPSSTPRASVPAPPGDDTSPKAKPGTALSPICEALGGGPGWLLPGSGPVIRADSLRQVKPACHPSVGVGHLRGGSAVRTFCTSSRRPQASARRHSAGRSRLAASLPARAGTGRGGTGERAEAPTVLTKDDRGNMLDCGGRSERSIRHWQSVLLLPEVANEP